MLNTVFNKFIGVTRSSALINLVLTPLLTSLLLLLSSVWALVVTLTVGSIQLSSMKANTRELSETACRTTTQIIRDNSRTVGVTAQWSMAYHLTQS